MGAEVLSDRAPEHARVQRPACAYEAFRAIAEAVSQETDLRSLLESITERACALLSVSRSSVYLVEEATGLYRGHLLRVGERVDDRVNRLACGVEADGFTREILATKQPVLVGDAMLDPRPIHSTMVAWNVHALLGVPMVLRGAVIGILFFDDQGRPHQYSDADLEAIATFANLSAIVVAQARTTAKLRASLSTVARQNKALRQAAIAENRLAELVLDGAGLAEIAGAVAQLTGKPCAIDAADGRRMAEGMPPGTETAVQLLDAEARARPEVASALAGVRAGDATVVGPFPAAGIAHRFLVSPVMVHGEEWGRIVLKECPARLSAFDALVARGAATIVALEFSAERRAAAVHAQTRETLLRDLIAGVGDEATLTRRAAVHALLVEDPHVMCLVRDERAAHGGIELEAVRAAVPELAGALVAGVPDGVVLVLPASGPSVCDPIASAVELMERLLEAAPGTTWIAAVSQVFSGVAGFARSYDDICQVGRCLTTFCGDGTRRVLSVSELGSGRLFLSSTARADADRFVRQTLGPLVAHPDRSMRDLLATLSVFCTASHSVRQAAEQLGVHENTIRYRLGRITELTGLDVAANADHQLASQLATLVLRLEGKVARTESAVASIAA
jgi:sugar diacid utilization regulator